MTASTRPHTQPSARAPRPRAVAVGAICATRILQVDAVPALPAKVLARRAVEVIDGMALSAACAFARLGGQAAVWARVGDDAPGRATRQALADEGLDARHLRSLPGCATSLSSVIVDAHGERLVVPFHDPEVPADADWLPLDELAEADWLLVDVRWPQGAEAALRGALAAGVPAMLDGDVAPPEWLQRLVPLATHRVFSDAGLRACTGLADIDTALAQVWRVHGGHVGATCGAKGYRWVESDGRIAQVAAPAVRAVDTLAAGDVFHGAFALALCEGQAVADAARFACHAASLKCTRFGGRLGCPSRDEVLASLSQA